jgi:hypothetical protein
MPGQFSLPGMLNSSQFGAGAVPFAAAPTAPAPSALAPTAPQSVTYPSPVNQSAKDQDLAAIYAAAGMPAPAADPFAVAPSPASKPSAPLSPFADGAAPFSFAGPGSNIVSPSQIATADAVPMPQPRLSAADAPPATDLSSSNRPSPPGAAYAAAPVNPAAVNRLPPAAAPSAPAAPASAPTSSPAPFSFGGVGDRLNLATKGFLGNLSGGPVGAVLGGLGALATGEPTDAGTIATRKQNATAQALIAKGVPVADVQAAVNNPDVMKTLVTQYFGPNKFDHVTRKDAEGAEIPGSYDPVTGKYKWESIPADATGGTVMGPNGQPIAIPAGVNRKAFVRKISENAADVASGKQTEAQAKASQYAVRMSQAEKQMGPLQDQGLNFWDRAADSLPGGVGNYAQSGQYQQYKQAQSAFITALLRQESGAAISQSEFSRYEKEMFPQPGDSPQVVQQKAQQRVAAIQQMQRAAGPGYQAPGAAPVSGKTAGGLNWSVQ